LQWFVKLSVAIATSIFCGAVLPIAVLYVGGRITGQLAVFLPRDLVLFWPLQMALMTFAAFWCACLVKGTARSAMLVFPVMGSIMAGGVTSEWVGGAIAPLSIVPVQWFISSMDPIHANKLAELLTYHLWDLTMILQLAAATLVGIALKQSHQTFREQAQGGKLRVIRRIVPLFSTVLLGGLAFALIFQFAFEVWGGQQTIFSEIHGAIQNIRVDSSKAGISTIRAEDLPNFATLSPVTKALLAHANILVVARQPERFLFLHGGTSFPVTGADANSYPYLAVIRLKNDESCSINFRKVARFGSVSGSCD
jgi:hypothetical protein